jgi:hypothetical protein
LRRLCLWHRCSRATSIYEAGEAYLASGRYIRAAAGRVPGHCAKFVESSGGARGSIGSIKVPLRQERMYQFHQFQNFRNIVKPCDI